MRDIIFCLFALVIIALGKEGFGPTDQDWGFVTVREKAHIFWWLHYTTANVTSVKDKPLILWLQGGPGSSSTGDGNFAELGPLDTNLAPRNSTWVQYANVLFVDNPVGSGFSYVEDESLLVTNNSQIADDFMVFLKEFFTQNSDFQTVPFYIFTESYGGKMTVEITKMLIKEVEHGNIHCNLTGIALGNSFISPEDTVINYAPFLLNLGIIDYTGFEKIDKVAQQVHALIEARNYSMATNITFDLYNDIKKTYGIDLYNVLNKKKADYSASDPPNYPGESGVPSIEDETIDYIMNGLVTKALNLSRPWGTQSKNVMDVLAGEKGDIMAPVVEIVADLLNNKNVNVAVYTGVFDFMCNTPGTISWINKMNWIDKANWLLAPRNSFSMDGYFEGYVKKAENFAVYWVQRSGHMVPADNPSGMYYILSDVTNNFEV